MSSCRIRRNSRGRIGLRLRWSGFETYEGTTLLDTPENRARLQSRADVIEQEMRAGVFDYLHWFPNGNMAERVRAAVEPGKRVTIQEFFAIWADSKRVRPVSHKWALNRASHIGAHVLPILGRVAIEQLTTAHLLEVQGRLVGELAASTIDGIIHSSLRAMLRDAGILGYAIPNLDRLYSSAHIQRLQRSGGAEDIDPFSAEERDAIIEAFRTKRSTFYAFVVHQFWTGARPSEAIALRWGRVDLKSRRLRIRGSMVLGREGRNKTGRSRRDVVIHDVLVGVLRDHQPLSVAPEQHVFTSRGGKSINQDNFYRREWLPILKNVGIRPRPFYQTRHTYITCMLSMGVPSLFVSRQTGTSLEMIERHYGGTVITDALIDRMIQGENGEPAGNHPRQVEVVCGGTVAETVAAQGKEERAGDRGRTGDVQLGKLNTPKTARGAKVRSRR